MGVTCERVIISESPTASSEGGAPIRDVVLFDTSDLQPEVKKSNKQVTSSSDLS